MNKLSYTLFAIIIINAIVGGFFASMFLEQKPTTVLKGPIINSEQFDDVARHPLIDEVNNINRRIRSFSSNKIEAKIWTGKIRVKLKGKVKYQKSRYSRMVLNSIFGAEADMGSNEDVFWYWSKRDKNKGLKYAKHDDYFDTRLKTGLHPDFMMMCLGIDEIKTRNAKIVDQVTSIAVIREEYSSSEKFFHITFVDKRTRKINGFVVADLNNQPIITCEIIWSGDLPAKNTINWHRENKYLTLEYYEIDINKRISSEWWIMPEYQPRINLAK